MEHNPYPALWEPTQLQVRSSHLYQYLHFLNVERLAPFLQNTSESDLDGASNNTAAMAEMYRAMQEWSVTDPAAFWKSVWDYFNVISHQPYTQVLSNHAMPHARWFEGATLNYAEHVFRKRSGAHPAIYFQNERDGLSEISWLELENQTAAIAAFLRSKGVVQGDRVVAFLPNTPHAIAAVLACMSLGAVWSSCSPDFGAASVVDRFAQIQPKVMFAVDGYAYGGKSFDKTNVVQELCGMLPSLETLVFIPYLNTEAGLPEVKGAILWKDVLKTSHDGLAFEAVPFEHPIWVLFSSGTTGLPKAITHGHGGNLLEHLKYLHFHNDIHEGENFFWFSTTGWMMWNFTLASLLTGATVVLYDGNPGYPNLNVLWELAAQLPIHHFGTSAPYLVACKKAGLEPGKKLDLSALRTIGSTGSPLPPEAYDWVYGELNKNVWLSSMSGGTDVCTAWVGGNPWLPVYQGYIQCRCLGCAMESWDENGVPVAAGEVGEMVVKKPMPSMPVFFWNDPDGSQYKNSYFEHYPGVWRHGDWLRILSDGSLQILGRSDATLNRQGVRIGTAEIYRALDQLPQIRDSLIVNIEYPDGSDWMPLFVTLQEGVELDEVLVKSIKQILRQAYSPRHVPDEVVPVPDIPYTISGKKMETPVKKILQHKSLDKAYNRDSMKNPESMDFFKIYAEKFGR